MPKSRLEGAEGFTDGETAEATVKFVKGYAYWKIAEAIIYLGLVIASVFAIFRSRTSRVGISVTSIHSRNLGDNSRIEFERDNVSDIPLAYYAYLAAMIKLVMSCIQIYGTSGHDMLHIWLNRKNAVDTNFVESPTDNIGLFENSLVWPVLFVATNQLTGLSDWQVALQLGAFAYLFAHYVRIAFVYRDSISETANLVVVSGAVVFGLGWSLIATHEAAHETDYPVSFYVYNWFFIITSVLFILVTVLVRQNILRVPWIMSYIVFFHMLLISTLTISCIVVTEEA